MSSVKIKLVKLPKKDKKTNEVVERSIDVNVDEYDDETKDKSKDKSKNNETKDITKNITSNNIGLNNSMINLSVPKKRMMRRTNIKVPQSNIVKMRTTGTKTNKNKSKQYLRQNSRQDSNHIILTAKFDA